MNKNTNETSTLKGVIAVMSTLLVVVIIVLVGAKLLFVPETSDTIKTGRVTSTASLAVTTTNRHKQTTKAKKKTTQDADDYYANKDDGNGSYTKQTVISAVYLHPQPTSSSENLLVIPVGAECKVYRNENGWLYLDYEGQKGYAYYTFFTEN